MHICIVLYLSTTHTRVIVNPYAMHIVCRIWWNNVISSILHPLTRVLAISSSFCRNEALFFFGNALMFSLWPKVYSPSFSLKIITKLSHSPNSKYCFNFLALLEGLFWCKMHMFDWVLKIFQWVFVSLYGCWFWPLFLFIW